MNHRNPSYTVTNHLHFGWSIVKTIVFSVTLLFEIMQCYNCLLYMSFFPHKDHISYLDIIKHGHLYLVKTYINS